MTYAPDATPYHGTRRRDIDVSLSMTRIVCSRRSLHLCSSTQPSFARSESLFGDLTLKKNGKAELGCEAAQTLACVLIHHPSPSRTHIGGTRPRCANRRPRGIFFRVSGSYDANSQKPNSICPRAISATGTASCRCPLSPHPHGLCCAMRRR